MALVFLVALICLRSWGGARAPLIDDSTRDLLRARACVEQLVACTTLETHADHLSHGTLWMRFLITLRTMGLDPVAQSRVLTAFIALAAALVFLWSERVSPPFFAPFAAVSFLWLCEENLYTTLWNPTLAVLPATVFFLALDRYLADSRSRWLVISSVAAFAAADSEVACFILLPFLITVAVLSSPAHPAADALTAVIPFALGALLLSAEAWTITLSASSGILVPFTFSTATAALIAGALRRRWSMVARHLRTPILAVSLVAAFLCTQAIVERVMKWQPQGYYGVSIWPVLAILPGGLWTLGVAAVLHFPGLSLHPRASTESPWRSRLQLPRAVQAYLDPLAFGVTAGAAALVFPSIPHDGHQWGRPVGDVRTLAAALQHAGFGYDKVWALRGPRLSVLRPQLGLFDPIDGLDPAMVVGPTMRLVQASRTDVEAGPPTGWNRVDTIMGVALTSPIRAWVSLKPVRAFVEGVERPVSTPAVDQPELPSWWAGVWPDGAFDFRRATGLPFPDRQPVALSLPVENTDGATSHVLDLVSDLPHSNWRIDAVDGVSGVVSENHRRVILSSAPGQKGHVAFSLSGPYGDQPLEFMETLPEETRIRELLTGRGPPGW